MSEFIDKIRADTTQKLRELDEERAQLKARIEQLQAEADEIRTTLAPVLSDGRMVPAIERPKSAPKRKPYVRISTEDFRDWARQQQGEFTATDAAKAFDISRDSAFRKLRGLTDRTPPVLARNGTGSGTRYSYIHPRDNTTGPNERPNGEPRIAPTEGAPKATVPHTGRGKGPSGKPGLDKKHAAMGHRVRRDRQGT